MRGISRSSLVEVTRRLDENVLASADAAQYAVSHGGEIFEVVGLLSNEHSLRRWLADQANTAEDKTALMSQILEGKVSPSTVIVVSDVVSQPWSSARDLIDALERMAVYATVGEAVERARAGKGPTLIESKVYRLSAHGNIIAPPGVPLHYPEHEAITMFGKREEYEAALRGDPVPRFRGILVNSGVLTAAKADEIATKVTAEMQAAVDFALKSPFPKLEYALDHVYA